MDTASSRLKRREAIQLVIGSQFKRLHLSWCRGALVPTGLATCTSGRAPSIPHPGNMFFKEGLAYLSNKNTKPHIPSVTTAWLCCRRVWVLDWPACSQDLSPTENTRYFMKHKIQQRRARTLELLQSYIRQEWDKISLPKVQQLLPSVPRCLQTAVKRRGDEHSGKDGPVPSFFKRVAAIFKRVKYWFMIFAIDLT